VSVESVDERKANVASRPSQRTLLLGARGGVTGSNQINRIPTTRACLTQAKVGQTRAQKQVSMSNVVVYDPPTGPPIVHGCCPVCLRKLWWFYVIICRLNARADWKSDKLRGTWMKPNFNERRASDTRWLTRSGALSIKCSQPMSVQRRAPAAADGRPWESCIIVRRESAGRSGVVGHL